MWSTEMLLSIHLFVVILFSYNLVAPATTDCRKGWQLLNEDSKDPVCIKIEVNPTFFLDAVKKCRANGGELATILNSKQQRGIHSAIEKEKKDGKKKMYWIGLNDFASENTYTWASGYHSVPISFWAEGQPDDEQNLQDCIALNSSKPANASWSDERCNNKYPYVCMIAKFPDAPKGLVFETKNGSCPKDFFRMGNRCLQIFTEIPHQNFSSARDTCKQFGKRGDLASVFTVKEQNILTAMMINRSVDVWIGLYLPRDSLVHVWSRDQADVSFTNWKRHEPNGGQSERCGMMYRRMSSAGQWNDQRCNVKLGYVCESDLIPKTTADEDSNNSLFKQGKCRKGEIIYNDFCYQSPKDEFSSYEEAEEACQSFHENGHLVSPNHVFENAFTNVLMNYLKINYTLLGYRIKELKNNYKIIASDKTSTFGFESLKNIRYHEVKNISCIASTADPQNRISVTNCSVPKKFSAICRYPRKESPHHPMYRNFTCEDGWKKILHERCVRLFRDPLSMYEASKKCKELNSSLMSILGPHDQQVASELALKTSNGVWIGLEVLFSLEGEVERVRWGDGLSVTFMHWRANEPSEKSRSGDQEKCVVLRKNSNDWNNVVCSKQYPFICSKAGKKANQTTSPTTTKPVTTKEPVTTAKPTKPTKPTEPTVTKTTTTTGTTTTSKPTTTPSKVTPKPSPKCPEGFNTRHYSNCYKIITTEKTWHDAEEHCKTQSGSNLASVHDVSENQFLMDIMKRKAIKTELWIGLSDLYGPVENQFSFWSDNSSMTILFMNKTQKSYFGNQDCVVITSSGIWNTKHCTTTAGFICKWQSEKKNIILPPEEKPAADYCSKGFVKFKQSCYKLMTTPENFTNAEKKCKNLFPSSYQKKIHLARVSMLEDNDFLLSLLSPIKNSAAWIGLHYEKDKFHWTDNWPMFYSRWPINMTYTNQDTTCVALGASTVTLLTGFWYARNCHDRLPYLCQAPLIEKNPSHSKLQCHKSYYLYKDGKTCYRRLKEPTTFAEGQKKCEDDKRKLNLLTKPTLLTLDSVFEMSFFRAWMLWSGGATDRPVWLGLKLQKDKPVWKWINGDPVVFTYTSGFPQDVSGCYFMYIHHKISKNAQYNEYGMHPDPKCGAIDKRIAVCKYSLDTASITPKPKQCLATKEGFGYAGHQAVTQSGKPCIRWDTLNDMQVLMRLGPKIGGYDSNFCRNPTVKPYQRDAPYCFTTRGKTEEAGDWEYCNIPLCASALAHAGGHNYVVAVAIIVIVLLVTISFFVGVMLWRRTNTARGFIPYLRQHDPEGGTSFHNPIYTPAANC